MSGEREPFRSWLERMAAAGFHPSRERGQNFLLDPTLHRAIAAAVGAGPGDVVLEVGAGLGFLTRELAATGARVVAVELDPRLHALLAEDLRAWPGAAATRVELVHADVLAGEDERFHPAVLAALAGARAAAAGGRFLLAANLPYSISGPFLARLALLDDPPATAVLLVQRELGDRLRAAPGSRTYGALSALVASVYDVEMERKVGREVFRPRPKVDSALLRLRRRADAEFAQLPRTERLAFAAFVRGLFAGRRKMLRSILGERCPADLEPALLAARPEVLTAAELLALFRRLPRPTGQPGGGG
ncbi:MAG: ribosomal RNA small subunit methyltransferase A [Planctomycetes bacterium]|nr:ribosomal RNA small subunit methyltransferase A [Planctomycetota bacterium]